MKSLFIENHCYHEETLYPLVFEKSSSDEDVVCSAIPRVGKDLINFIDRTWVEYSFLRALLLIIKTPNLSCVYFNTLESIGSFALAYAAKFRGIEVRAIAHNADMFFQPAENFQNGIKIKYFGVFSRRLLTSVVSEFYVLSEDVKNYCESGFEQLEVLSTRSLSCLPTTEVESVKETGVYYIGILGDISYHRRSYETLLSLPQQWINKNTIKFIMLGDSTQLDGPHFRERVQEKNLCEHFVFFENYLSYRQLFYCIGLCRGMLLVNKSSKYGKTKTAATTHIGNAFGVEVLLLKGEKDIATFKHWVETDTKS